MRHTDHTLRWHLTLVATACEHKTDRRKLATLVSTSCNITLSCNRYDKYQCCGSSLQSRGEICCCEFVKIIRQPVKLSVQKDLNQCTSIKAVSELQRFMFQTLPWTAPPCSLCLSRPSHHKLTCWAETTKYSENRCVCSPASMLLECVSVQLLVMGWLLCC